MANQIKLSARPRTEVGSNAAKKVRSRGSIPANIYGKGSEPFHLEINQKAVEQVLAHASGENILVELEIEDQGKTTNRLSLIQEVQHHPVRRDVLHVDFHAVSATETLEAEVPIEPVGEADGVKNSGGILQQNLRSLAIECLPKDLPDHLNVDVSALKLGDSIHVRDLVLPAGVTAAVDGEVTVFHVSEPTVAPEPVAEVAAAPEVLKEKKAEAAPAAEKK
ncbi:MAG TPA: 50S ribosomal protein L25/general stress protein Ctc [Chthoniobacterales bacterium]